MRNFELNGLSESQALAELQAGEAKRKFVLEIETFS
jgi:hypothetical protein